LADGRDLWFANGQQIAGLDVAGAALATDFLDVLSHCDLYVFTGMGAFADIFEAGVMPMLATIQCASSFGVPVVAFGQGIGAIRNPSPLWTAMQDSMRLLSFISVREGTYAPGILQTMGVSAERIYVTGDDAIELAFQRSSAEPGKALGVNFRRAPYSNVNTAAVEKIVTLLRNKAEHYEAEIVPITISTVPWECDLTTLLEVLPELSGQCRIPVDPSEVVVDIDRCRVVVTGSYHGAVFALSRGVPALCIAQSPYYRYKFGGLADMFGEGCTVIDGGQAEESAIHDALDSLWNTAAQNRSSLLQRAERQVQASRNAYVMLKQFTSSMANREWTRASSLLDLLPHGYRRCVSKLTAQLTRARADIRQLEEARDWYREQADGARKQLTETTAYLHQVEEAREWHRNRAEALEAQRAVDAR
jgi:polysaccharide pyruvyl transferase WcaK-like protein